MTLPPIAANGRVAAPVVRPAEPRPADSNTAAARALAQAFAAAMPGRLAPRTAPRGNLESRSKPTGRDGLDDAPAEIVPGAQSLPPETPVVRRPTTPDSREPTPVVVPPAGLPSILASASPPAAGQVDATAFAELMTQLWSRETVGGAPEVRVRFGDEAWPATGARLVRLDDGSLQVHVEVGSRGDDADRSIAALRRRLSERGLAIGAIAIDEDAATGRGFD